MYIQVTNIVIKTAHADKDLLRLYGRSGREQRGGKDKEQKVTL